MFNIPRGAKTRTLLCFQILTIAFFSFLYPVSVVNTLENHCGESVWLVLTAMCILAIIGLADAFINDILPDRFQMQWTLRCRHFIYMFLAIGYAMMMSFTIRSGMYEAIPYFLINIGYIVGAAYTDVSQRYSPKLHRRRGETDKENSHA